jgi:hypothetical protein
VWDIFQSTNVFESCFHVQSILCAGQDIIHVLNMEATNLYSAAQTYLDAVHTHFGSCYAGSKTCITRVQSVSGHHSSFWGKKIDQAKGRQYVCTLPAIATICTYNVGSASICKTSSILIVRRHFYQHPQQAAVDLSRSIFASSTIV